MTMGFIVGYLVFIGYLVFTYMACLAQARLIKECPTGNQAQTGFEPEKVSSIPKNIFTKYQKNVPCVT